MHRREFLRIAGGATAGAFLPIGGVTGQTSPHLQDPQDDGWIPLFNGRNLDGWYSMLRTSGRGVAETKGYVTIENGMIHILGNKVNEPAVEPGYIATLTEYENYRVRVEYRWGVARFAPRLEAKRDNGLCYHVVGPDRVWPTCAEFQIQETDTGDAWLLTGARAARARNLFDLPAGGASAAGGGTPPAGAAAAPTVTPTSGRILKEGDFENLEGWNVAEVVTQGDRALHIVNGRIVNSLTNIEQPDPQNAGRFIPLTRGKIALQIEYAEIWFRRVEIKPSA